MNKVIIKGRLTRDPFVNEKLSMARYSVACENMGKVDFIPVLSFNKTAEDIYNCSAFRKGALVEIEGYLHNGSYEKDGKKVYTLDVISNKVNLLTDKAGFSVMTEEEMTDNPFN